MTEPRAYPPSRRDDAVATRHHGTRVPDPYRWLEDAESEETKRWIGAQNQHTESHLRTIAQRPSIQKHLAEIWNEPHAGAPWRQGRWWFEMRHDGVQNQEVLFVGAAASDGAPPPAHHFRALLDVNRLAPDGTVSITGLSSTPDGNRLAYGLSEAGSDWVTWRVRDVASGKDSGDIVPWSKFGSAAWLPDGESFVYPAYDPPDPGTEFAAASRNQKLRLHVLGTLADQDPVVHEAPDQPEWTFDPTTTHDGRWLVISTWEGGLDSNRIYLAPIEGDRVGRVRLLIGGADALFHFAGVAGRSFVFLTNHDAPRWRVVAVDPDRADSCSWETLVPESEDRIDAARFLGGASPGDDAWILLHRWRHATSRLSRVPLAWKASVDAGAGASAGETRSLGSGATLVPGGPPTELPLPESLGSILALTGDRQDGRFHIQYETFLAPAQVFYGNLSRIAPGGSDPGAGELTSRPAASGEEAFAGGAGAKTGSPPLLTEQTFVEHDGVRIPVFLLRRADVLPNGDVPTLLYGYGGFDVATTPAYSIPWRAWVERGGLVAVACLRGGGEYGTAWHDAGKTPHKQNVFDDAIAVATWLTTDATVPATPARTADTAGATSATTITSTMGTARWTSPTRLGILGRSNGGLLVGACMTQRPDLFGACVPEVGVMDMLRFHLFTIGSAWVSDYGSAEDAEQFRELLDYSPLHNLREGTCYPPTLITTGDHDDRVVPGHSFKFTAALQHAQGCGHPALIRIDVAAGHGAGKPLSKRIDERADVLAFLAHHLGMD